MTAAEYLRKNDADAWTNPDARLRMETGMFHGHYFDGTMLRLGAMNMALHGFEDASIVYRDSLTQAHGGEAEAYSLILANPPFAGSLATEAVAKGLIRIVNTPKTELLFLALLLRLLKRVGRAALVVPDGGLFGTNRAHKCAASWSRNSSFGAWSRFRKAFSALSRRLNRDPALPAHGLRRHRRCVVLPPGR